MSRNGWISEVLPSGWESPKLGDLCEVIRGASPRPMGDPRYFGGTIPFVKIADVTRSNRMAVYDAETKVTPDGALRSRLISAGRLILTNSATVCVPVFLGVDACIHDGFVAFDGLPDFVDQKFLYYFFTYIRPYVLDEHKQGVTQVNLNTAIVGEMSLLLPPCIEQLRIVGKIEELFSELDKAVENLTTAREQLKVYRQALLKHAFEGKLTADWRKRRNEEPESATELRLRLAVERHDYYQTPLARWRAAVENWEQAGSIGAKPSRVRSLQSVKSLSAEVLETLPSLPEGWAWEKLGWMTCGVDYGTSAKSSKTGAVPVIRMGNIQNGRIDWSDLAFTDDAEEIAQYRLTPGDVLFNRTNSPELVGKTAIYNSEMPALFAGYLIRVNHNPAVVDGQYLNMFLNSHTAKHFGNKVKTDGVNQSNINGEKLQGYPFPFCSLAEQKEIVRVLDEKLSSCDHLIGDIESQFASASTLRLSVLRKAFSGQLVAQDPNDESVSVLLERIRAVKQQGSGGKKTRKRRTEEAA